jgi:hypothetical protein
MWDSKHILRLFTVTLALSFVGVSLGGLLYNGPENADEAAVWPVWRIVVRHAAEELRFHSLAWEDGGHGY